MLILGLKLLRDKLIHDFLALRVHFGQIKHIRVERRFHYIFLGYMEMGWIYQVSKS
jgi:hypothetical protein